MFLLKRYLFLIGGYSEMLFSEAWDCPCAYVKQKRSCCTKQHKRKKKQKGSWKSWKRDLIFLHTIEIQKVSLTYTYFIFLSLFFMTCSFYIFLHVLATQPSDEPVLHLSEIGMFFSDMLCMNAKNITYKVMLAAIALYIHKREVTLPVFIFLNAL